jgi:hypothetical protein
MNCSEVFTSSFDPCDLNSIYHFYISIYTLYFIPILIIYILTCFIIYKNIPKNLKTIFGFVNLLFLVILSIYSMYTSTVWIDGQFTLLIGLILFSLFAGSLIHIYHLYKSIKKL